MGAPESECGREVVFTGSHQRTLGGTVQHARSGPQTYTLGAKYGVLQDYINIYNLRGRGLLDAYAPAQVGA